MLAGGLCFSTEPNRDPGTNRNKRLTNLRKSARRGVPIGADRAPS
jgi:hypothetical protein